MIRNLLAAVPQSPHLRLAILILADYLEAQGDGRAARVRQVASEIVFNRPPLLSMLVPMFMWYIEVKTETLNVTSWNSGTFEAVGGIISGTLTREDEYEYNTACVLHNLEAMDQHGVIWNVPQAIPVHVWRDTLDNVLMTKAETVGRFGPPATSLTL